MRPFKWILAGLFLLFPIILPVALQAEPMPFGEGLLWRVERDGGAPSCVFGTMHSVDPRIVSLPEPAARCFGHANSLVVEIVFDDALQPRMAEMMKLHDGQSLDEVIGADLFAAAAEIGASYWIPAEALRLLEPWAVAMIYSLTPEEMLRSGRGEPFLDKKLQLDARAKGTTVFGLETVEEQLGPFDSLPMRDQRRLLESAIGFYPQLDPVYARMKELYLAGRTDAIVSLLRTVSAGTDADLLRWFEDQMITRRNHRMAARLGPRLAEGGAFIAIGAGHLPGEEGLLRLLERQGYRLTRLY